MLFSVIFFLSACLPSEALNFTESGRNDFHVSLDGILVFRHTEQDPILFVGTGRTEFVEYKGNFHINDYVTSRIPLFNVSEVIFSEDSILRLKLSDNSDHIVLLTLTETKNHSLTIEFEVGDSAQTFDRLWLRLTAEPDELVYGGGEQFSFLNLRGRSYPIWTREQGVGRNKSTLTTFYSDLDGGSGGDYHTTYFPQPSFISSRNYFLHHAGPNYAVLDFSHDSFHELLIHGAPGPVFLQTSTQPQQLISSLTQILGRQPLLPDWVHTGAILGVQGGTQQMLDYLQQAEKHGVAVAGLWIQDWVGRITTSFGRRLFWDWHWNPEQYPNLTEEIQSLRSRGIRVLAYINPYLNQQGSLFKVADELGFFVKNASNQTYLSDFGEFFCGTIDLTNPEAYNWYKDEIIKKNMIEFGFGGWMADFGEYLPTEGVVFHSGQSAIDLHNQWPVMWAKLNREAVEESGKLGDIVFWMRAGFSGSGNYSTLMWAGDQNVDFSMSDGIASTVVAALSMGMSGVGLTHFDIGGFTTFASYNPPLVRTEECLLRSAEMAVFTPVFRTHEGNQPTANVQFYSNQTTLRKFARLSRMFSAMQNYTRHVVSQTATTGLPCQSPLFLHYPSDLASYHVNYQYMFGRDVIVAPVYLPDVESWDVYLPSDPEASWIFLWDESTTHSGGRTVRVPAPLGHPPVFYRNISEFVDVFRHVAQV